MLASCEAASEARMARGEALYMKNCAMCHQTTGGGTPDVFPPLAESDFLKDHPERVIKALVEGLSGKITVNGHEYNGVMPPVLLNDAEVADVLTFVYGSWGNDGRTISPEEVAKIRATSRVRSFEALEGAFGYPPLPDPPEGFSLRELVRLPEQSVRLADARDGRHVLVLQMNGDVWTLDPESGAMNRIVDHQAFIHRQWTSQQVRGITVDSKRRIYLVLNERNTSVRPVACEVTIVRTQLGEDNAVGEWQEWFRTQYPWGIGGFQHSVGHIAEGPDGMIYVSSGSRTDGNERSPDPNYFSGGEVGLTACLWRLDPEHSDPELEIFARGLRNTWGFCWNESGELFGTDNGPDAHAPEELNRLTASAHYGFPFQFADWPNKPYSYTPNAPEGTKFTHPIINLGPNGGFSDEPVSTFDPHSSPAGIIHLGGDFPLADYRDSFLVTRYGNLLKLDKDVGYDLLHVKLTSDGSSATIRSILEGLGRPIDILQWGSDRIIVLEFSRSTSIAQGAGNQPGRILELKALE